MTAAAPPAAGVVRAGPEHLELLAAFYRDAGWDARACAAGVRAARRAAAARNPVNPGEAPPTFLFVVDGRAVGHLGTLPLRLWTPDGDRGAHWLKGLMVLPEHRNGPVAFFLLREAVSRLGTTLAMVVAPPARRVFEAVGHRELGGLPDAVRPLHPARILARLDPAALEGRLPHRLRRVAERVRRAALLRAAAGASARGALAAWAALRSRPGRAAAGVLVELPTGAAEGLWRRVREGIEAGPARDPAALRERYVDGGGYRLLGVEDEGGLAGFAAVRPPRAEGDPRLNGVRLAAVSELVFDPARPAVAAALLRGAEEVARSLDADALLCAATHPAARAALRARGYLPMGEPVRVLARSGPGEPGLPPAASSWWLTRGDGHADEVI